MERGNIVWFWSGGISRWRIWTPHLEFLARGMGILTTKTLYKNSGGCKLGIDVKVSYISQSTCIESSIYSKIYVQIIYALITKCIQHFMIHKRSRLSRCSITQSSKSMQESIDRFLSYTSLQKVLKLILPPNNRHFLSNHRVFRLFNDKRPAKIPNIFRRLIRSYGWTWSGLGLFFQLMNVAIYFLTLQCLAG